MAIDTKLKRASVQAYQPSFMRPPPDGSVDAADRAMCAYFYAGLNYGPPVAAAIINIVQEIAVDIVRKIAFEPTVSRRDIGGG